jgi:hypothetical protein
MTPIIIEPEHLSRMTASFACNDGLRRILLQEALTAASDRRFVAVAHGGARQWLPFIQPEHLSGMTVLHAV